MKYEVLLQQIRLLCILLKNKHPLVVEQLEDAYAQLEMEKDDEYTDQSD